MNIADCPVARAAKDQLKVKTALEGAHFTYTIKGCRRTTYNHERYDDKMFDRDSRKAKGAVHNKIIRTLTLTPRM